MLQSGGSIEMRSHAAEAEFFEEVERGGVFGMMPGEKRVGGNRFESVSDGGAGSLFGETLSPEFGP